MTQSEFTIRPFRAEDLPRLIEITGEAFDGVSIDQATERLLGTVADRSWQWRKGQAIRYDTDRFPQGAFVARRESEILGYITTWIDDSTRTGYIPNIAVAAGHRGQGIGRKLIEHALAYFRQQRLRLARIETLVQNEVGRKLYPSLGFREIATQVHYAMKLDQDRDAEDMMPKT